MEVGPHQVRLSAVVAANQHLTVAACRDAACIINDEERCLLLPFLGQLRLLQFVAAVGNQDQSCQALGDAAGG
jgi:hypothetical protein